MIFVHTLSTWSWVPASQFSNCVLIFWNIITDTIEDVMRSNTSYTGAMWITNVKNPSQIQKVCSQNRKKKNILFTEWGRCMSMRIQRRGTEYHHRDVAAAGPGLKAQVDFINRRNTSVSTYANLCKQGMQKSGNHWQPFLSWLYIALLLKNITSEHTLTSR